MPKTAHDFHWNPLFFLLPVLVLVLLLHHLKYLPQLFLFHLFFGLIYTVAS